MVGVDPRPARFGPWWGGAILVGLVALMVVVAAVRGTVVAGESTAAPGAAPPGPGECLRENLVVGGVGRPKVGKTTWVNRILGRR